MDIFCIVENSLVDIEESNWLADRKVICSCALFSNSVAIVDLYKLFDSSAEHWHIDITYCNSIRRRSIILSIFRKRFEVVAIFPKR